MRVAFARRVGRAERCSYCHDSLPEFVRECERCSTQLHTDCAALARECPTLGCERSFRREPVRQPRGSTPVLLALAIVATPLSGRLAWAWWTAPGPRIATAIRERPLDSANEFLERARRISSAALAPSQRDARRTNLMCA